MLKAKLLGATAAAESLPIEDVFSTYLYTGNGSTQTITNGIDLAGEGGLWVTKRRDASAAMQWSSSEQPLNTSLESSSASTGVGVTAFSLNSDGYNINTTNLRWNASGSIYASWTFRQAPRFFDVVTYTGTGANRTIAHDLGVVPGCIIVKRTDTTGDWQVYHRSNTAAPETDYLVLNSTAATVDSNTRWNDTLPTSTVFSLGTDATVNASGGTYVAYLFAHDPLGPSGDGSDGLIACGSFTTDGSGNATVNLGWEPQWVLYKRSDGAGSWFIYDTMRGFSVGLSNDSVLYANLADAEIAGANGGQPDPTGFSVSSFPSGQTYIYIAIRRGPMREPTVGTEVFAPTVYTGTNADNRLVNTGLLTDMAWVRQRNDSVLGGMVVGDRMRGQPYLLTGTTAAELSDGDSFDQQIVSTTEYGTAFSSHVGFYVGNDATSKLNASTTANNQIAYSFRRAPGFFDAVAYTGTGANRTVSHNLGAIPELMIVKRRDATAGWAVYYGDNTDYLLLNSNASTADDISYWNDTSPTSALFTVGTNTNVNASGGTYIAYLFSSLSGISKVGSYTGTGSSQTINCGFTTGARFVLIKRVDSLAGLGSWHVFDTARGIIVGNDPHLFLNLTLAEVTNQDYLAPDNSGFSLTNNAPAALNDSGGTFIYLAIA